MALDSFLYSAKLDVKTYAVYNETTHGSILLTVIAVIDALRLVLICWFDLNFNLVGRTGDVIVAPFDDHDVLAPLAH